MRCHRTPAKQLRGQDGGCHARTRPWGKVQRAQRGGVPATSHLTRPHVHARGPSEPAPTGGDRNVHSSTTCHYPEAHQPWTGSGVLSPPTGHYTAGTTSHPARRTTMRVTPPPTVSSDGSQEPLQPPACVKRTQWRGLPGRGAHGRPLWKRTRSWALLCVCPASQ